ncbi:Heat shock protein 30 [Dissostichus eleginoides]|uniref:Heat shock protein 30 n=1 Tax=Dissostichus eleginoides TaxID=100907 RepID=A0AAD9BI59_DISEL|nr:Heat shock protein 30 [Dissostichus eleginoides]
MLCSPGFQSALSPFTSFYWPDLRSEVNPLLQQQDLLRRNLQELHSLMDKLQTDILEEPFNTSEQPAVSYYLQKEGGPDSGHSRLFSRGAGPQAESQTEKKQKDGEGCCSYRRQEFTQESDLPEGPDSEAVSCCLAPDGRLHIQEPGSV